MRIRPFRLLCGILFFLLTTFCAADTCNNGATCSGSTPYCSYTSGYCCAGPNEYACQDSSGNSFCSSSSSCQTGGGGGGGGGGGCQSGVNCTGSSPYCSLTSGYCCAGPSEYACEDSSGNSFCSSSSSCQTGGGGGGGGCQSGVNCTGSAPYCSLTSGYCCAEPSEYACEDSAGNSFCSASSSCQTGGSGGSGGNSGCQSGVNCTGSAPYCSLTSGYCCAEPSEYACEDSSGNSFCSASSSCQTGGSGSGGSGGNSGCQSGVNCTGSTPYCSNTSGYCCAGPSEYACEDSSGNSFCSTSSTCQTSGSGGGGGGSSGCQSGVNCTGSTPYCSNTSGYCCAGPSEYACEDSSGNSFCSTSSSCQSGGSGGGGGGCQSGVNCTGSNPYCSVNNSGICCSGPSEYACQDGSGNSFCSSSSTCQSGGGTSTNGGGGAACVSGVNCSGSTPYCSATSGYCCGSAGEYACQDSSGNLFCSASSTCIATSNGGACRNGVNCTGATPYCSITSGYCCAGDNEYACEDSSGNQFCSTSSTCGATSTGGGASGGTGSGSSGGVSKGTTASDYAMVVQELYVAYFGRPADPNGLLNFENALLQLKAPTNLQGMIAAYSSNSGVRSLVDSFGLSKESQTLYGTGSNTQFVQAIFYNVLGRQPATSGLTFWVGAVSSNQVSRGSAALQIMAGALANQSSQGLLDAQLIQNRLQVASYFTSEVSLLGVTSRYSGATAAASARALLSAVQASTPLASMEALTNTTIQSL